MRYVISIDISQGEIYGRSWRDYGRILAYGDTLEQLLKNAQVEIIDFDGKVVYVEKAASEWMLDLVKQEYVWKYELGPIGAA